MYHRVREAKYRLETVTFIWDFRDHINPNDFVVGTPLVEVLVSSGNDADPSILILGPPVVTEGTIVSQRIHKGIPGTIYTITITIHTDQGDTFEDYTYLAILPLPYLSFTYFLETMLYPIEMFFEGVTTSIALHDGNIFNSIIMATEGIISSIGLTDGTLFGDPLSYHMTILDGSGINGHEALLSFIALTDGTLFGSPMSYHMITEGMQSSIALIDGTLFGSPINYNMTTEGVLSYITIVDGTLA